MSECAAQGRKAGLNLRILRVLRGQAVLVTVLLAAPAPSPYPTTSVRRVEYADLPAAIQERFASEGISARRFPDYLSDVETETGRRLAEGEREHLVYYALQSSHFTRRARIEPAVSARRFVEALPPAERRRFLEDAAYLPPGGWPAAERARVADALTALAENTADARLSSLRQLRSAGGLPSVDGLYADYVRVARFLYKKEFGSDGNAGDVARLYQSRPHSSDTQIDAGFGVYLGLGVVHALAPAQPIRRILIVGPGLDVAPRTDLIDAVGPQMYQPFAVADALIALSMTTAGDLRIHSVDVNPRIVAFAQDLTRAPVTLHLFTGVVETKEHPFSVDYREYVHTLGRAIGVVVKGPATLASDARYQHSIAVRPEIARALTAERLNVVTERLIDGTGFDLAVITNVLTYFDDRQLALALSNIGAMLRPEGYLLHNEPRAGLVETAAAVGLPALQVRTALLGGAASHPWYDTVWVHQKKRT